MTEITTYQGSCHCGAVRFSVTTALDGLSDCNCSRCRRLGWIMQPVPADAFVLHAGAEKLKDYRFNTHKIAHLYCSDCGIEPFAKGADGEGKETVVVNVNCLDGVPEIDRAAIRHWNGKDF